MKKGPQTKSGSPVKASKIFKNIQQSLKISGIFFDLFEKVLDLSYNKPLKIFLFNQITGRYSPEVTSVTS